MRKLLILLLLFSLGVFAQSEKTANLDSLISKDRLTSLTGWKYQPGNNMDWAKPDFDDSGWKQFSGEGLAVWDSAGKPKREIAWFRKKIYFDSSSNMQPVLRIYQTGASEIYLNGELIHKLGRISSNPDSTVYYNPRQKIFSFPLMQGKENVLAIRYINLSPKFPLYEKPDQGMYIRIASLSYVIDNPAYNQQLENFYIVLGVAAFISILFFLYFIFFPTDKVNLYFSIGNFFFTLYIIWITKLFNENDEIFFTEFVISIFSTVQGIFLYYSFYIIFNRRRGPMFWFIIISILLCIPLLFLVPGFLIRIFTGMLILFDTIRVCIITFRINKQRALIFLFFNSISILFWSISILIISAKLDFPLFKYEPYAFLLTPMSIAIYLGYMFSIKSRMLGDKLSEVEQLSTEKQLILANQNEHLEHQVTERTAELNQSLQDLKAAQSQLIQSEKMASLGELTAGIAHEIQNPLNFVNNFSDLSRELILEIEDERIKDRESRDEALENEILSDIKQNLEKISHHGRRADSIVKGMLQHSRLTSGQKEPTDINALTDEYLRLAYHGLRAKDKSFNSEMIMTPDLSLPKANVVPQDIGRVLLNIFTNAFYAVHKQKENSSAHKSVDTEGYKPVVEVSTSIINNNIEIIVKDNGIGIPESVKEKIFQPFFTTKPTGEGTGLGLSMSYDIVKAHGGSIVINSTEGLGSSFTIIIPIT